MARLFAQLERRERPGGDAHGGERVAPGRGVTFAQRRSFWRQNDLGRRGTVAPIDIA